jgi:hypothetical protein
MASGQSVLSDWEKATETSGNDRNFCYECGDALPLPKLEDTAFCFERVEWNRRYKKVSKRVRNEEFEIEDN